MYWTKEIRWFLSEENEYIREWFDDLDSDSHEERTDLYLNLNDEKVGVKLRDGQIDIKHRLGTRAKGCLNTNSWGCFETFGKWSFSAQEGEKLYQQIGNGVYDEWVEIKKSRSIVQICNKNGKSSLLSPSIQVDSGCQLEYTDFELNDKRWFTFGLEWFGNETVYIEPDLISEILGDSALGCQQSMGYAEFLLNNLTQIKNVVLI